MKSRIALYKYKILLTDTLYSLTLVLYDDFVPTLESFFPAKGQLGTGGHMTGHHTKCCVNCKMVSLQESWELQ